MTPEISGGLTGLDGGLQFQFANVELATGEIYTGQVVGVYNEANFMWNPTEYTRLVLFTCSDPLAPLGTFSVLPGADPAIFSLSTADITSISIVTRPQELTEYQEYMRRQGHVFKVTPVEGEIWISRAWDSYHTWEDGRGNYAWDIGALNSNMMSYSYYGTRNTDYAVWGKVVRMPMAGEIVTAVEKEVDNTPNMTAAVDLEDNADGGNTVEEKPQNMIEIKVGGSSSRFLCRLIHLKQNSIPNHIHVGSHYPAGTVVGHVGNSGTTLVPHCHSVWGFFDRDDRYWALPIEWENVSHRILLAYPTGYQYGADHHHDYYYPKYSNLVTSL